MATIPSRTDASKTLASLAPSPIAEQMAQIALQLESSFAQNPKAYTPNSVGAVGPFQFTPNTAAQYGVTNPLDLADSAKGFYASLTNNMNKGMTPTQALVAHHSGTSGVLRAISQEQQTGKPWNENLGPNGQEYFNNASKLTGVISASPTPEQIAKDATTIGQPPVDTTNMTTPINTMPTAPTVPDQPKQVSDATRWKMAGAAMNTVQDVSNQFMHATQVKAEASNLFRNARAAANQTLREGGAAQSRIIAQTAGSGLDVGSTTTKDLYRHQGILTGEKAASQRTVGEQAKIAAHYQAGIDRVNGVLSLVSGYVNQQNLLAEDKPSLATKQPTLSDLVGGTLGSGRGVGSTSKTGWKV